MSVMNDRTSGYCGCGCGGTYRLGERDCGDYLVGYVDDGGLCWESLHERNQVHLHSAGIWTELEL